MHRGCFTGAGAALPKMKLVTMALACLLLATMWPQDVDSKSSEWGWRYLGEGRGSGRHSGDGADSLPPSPLLWEEYLQERQNGGLGWGGAGAPI